jgi:hypothetical protein
MPRFSALRPARPGLLVILLLTLGACTDWRVQSVEPAQFIRESHPREVRLGQRAGGTLTLRDPSTVGPEIRGVHGSDTLRMAAADVTTIAVKRTDWAKTAILVAIPPALLFGFACLAACGGY